MASYRRPILLFLFKLADLGFMVLAFITATIVLHAQRYNISLESFLEMRMRVQNFIILLIFLLTWHYLFSAKGLYHSKRLSSFRGEIIDVFRAIGIGTAIIFTLGWIFNIDIVTPTFMVLFFCICFVLTTSARFIMRVYLKKIRKKGRNLRYLTIVGTNQRAIQFADELNRHPELGYRINGFVDEHWPGIEEFQKSGYQLVTDLKYFAEHISSNVVDEVAIKLPIKSYYNQALQIIEKCKEQGIIVRMTSDLFNLNNDRNHNDILKKNEILTINGRETSSWPLAIKQLIDVILSITLLIVLSPVMLIVSGLIKITSPGPVFFIQERVGLFKRHFKLYKFRTMVTGAEKLQDGLEQMNEVDGPVFKIKNDPRITPIGRILRKTSLDEIPQLFNIIKGDMSLVGPRPLPVRDYKGFSEDWHRRRFSVKPGATCLWQAYGRNDIPFEKWMEMDMQYIDNWSLWLDIKILLKTIPTIFKRNGF